MSLERKLENLQEPPHLSDGHNLFESEASSEDSVSSALSTSGL